MVGFFFLLYRNLNLIAIKMRALFRYEEVMLCESCDLKTCKKKLVT